MNNWLFIQFNCWNGLGLLASLAIGITLGLIGGGGSILTIPVLVYLLKVDPVLATAYSLFIVGVTSLAGVVKKFKEDQVSIRLAMLFGTPSLLTIFLTRKYLVPAIPQEIVQVGSWTLNKGTFILLLFSLLMILASVSMIRGRKDKTEITNDPVNFPVIILEGILVGLLAGLVGAGGGFLIIPALVFGGKLPMKKAVGTSLLIIAAQSLVGFTGDLYNTAMEWPLLLMVSAMAIAGVMAGNLLSRKMEGEKLRKGFGWFVLIMGLYILFRQM